MEYQHGGDIYTNQVEYDYSANLNPLGLPEGVRAAYVNAAGRCSVYPDSRCRSLRAALADFHRVRQESILCGNGAAELIFLLAQARRPRRALLIAPSFLEYQQALASVGCEIAWFDLKEETGFVLPIPELLARMEGLAAAGNAVDMIFLCNPNNPTGMAVECGEMVSLLAYCEAHGITCVVDECFNEFLGEPERYSVLEEIRAGRLNSVFILKAFTKIYAMAGLRLGYGICPDGALLESMERCRQPWSVSGPAQAAGEAALRETDYVERTRELVRRERLWLKTEMEELGLFVYDSMANYLFFKDQRMKAEEASGGGPAGSAEKGPLYEACLKHGVLIRSCANYRGLDSRYYRICVKDRAENEAFIRVLTAVMKERR